MKESIKTVYNCDYCNKVYFSKSHASRHEKRCSYNPVNFRPCLQDCKYLEKKKDIISNMHGQEREVEVLHCSKKQIYLYPPKVEIDNRQLEDSHSPMPKECEEYKNYIFNTPFMGSL